MRMIDLVPRRNLLLSPMVYNHKINNFRMVSDNAIRFKLSDFKTYEELYSARLILTNALQAGLVSYAQVLNEFTVYVNSGNNPDHFNWSDNILKLLPSIRYTFLKLTEISIVKKSLQYYCVNNLTTFATDKLTKDIKKSAIRKIERYGRNTTMIFKTFRTSLLGNSLGYLAGLIVDYVEAFVVWGYNDKRVVRYQQTSLWMTKKLIGVVACFLSGSLGFAIGSAIDPNYCSFLCMALSESACSSGLVHLLGPL